MDQRRDQTGYQDVGVDDDPHSSRCCRVAAISVLISSRERRSAPASRALCCIDSIARNASVCCNADRVSSKVSGEVAERSAMGLPFDVTTICRSSSSARQTAADRLRSSRTLTKFITSPKRLSYARWCTRTRHAFKNFPDRCDRPTHRRGPPCRRLPIDPSDVGRQQYAVVLAGGFGGDDAVAHVAEHRSGSRSSGSPNPPPPGDETMSRAGPMSRNPNFGASDAGASTGNICISPPSPYSPDAAPYRRPHLRRHSGRRLRLRGLHGAQLDRNRSSAQGNYDHGSGARGKEGAVLPVRPGARGQGYA